MLKVIGFDLDNTLYDQAQFEYEIFRKIAKQVEIDFYISSELYFNALKKLYIEGLKDNVFNIALEKIDITIPNSWEKYIKNVVLPLYREFVPKQLKLFEESELYLSSIFSNYKIVLITNGREKIQNIKIDLLGIRKYFDLILISDMYEIPKRKPDSFMFSEALKYFNINASDMIYIGDDPIRDAASEKVGIKFIDIEDFKINKLEG